MSNPQYMPSGAGRLDEDTLTPHEITRQLAKWRMEVARIGSEEDRRLLADQLGAAPPQIRDQISPLLKAQPLPDEGAPDDVDGDADGAAAPSLDWVTETLAQVIEATGRLEASEAGATGLVPLGYLRDGGQVLTEHRVVIRDEFKGNRTALFAQSGKGKTNLVKVILFWILFNWTYGKLVFDYKGEYVPWTQNERGERVPGLCEHPLAKEGIVLYTTKQRHLQDEALNARVTVRPLQCNIRSILPRDFASFWPNMTPAQQEFLYTYDEDPGVYDIILGDEKEWARLGAWFGGTGSRTAEDQDGDTQHHGLDWASTRVVRNIRKKLLAAQKRPYIQSKEGEVHVDPLPDGTYRLHTPYRKPFVAALKQAVQARDRRYDPDTKTWIVTADGYPSAVAEIERFFGPVGDSDSLSLISQDLAGGKLVVVDLSGIASEPDRDLVATLITRRQFEHNLDRIDLDEGPEGRIPFVAFFEEAQNLLGAAKVRESKNSIFIRTFKEGRALAIGTTSITQQPGALSKDLTSQIAYYVVQHLRAREDIRELVAMDPALEGAESDIARRVPGNALYVDNNRGFPLPIKIDKFDAAFVEAVQHAYRLLERGDWERRT